MAKRGNFHNCFHNHTHDKATFSESEQIYANILKNHGVQFTHETMIKFKNDFKSTHFWLDFLIPHKRISIEINPTWHETYLPVVERDRVRNRLLRQKQHIRTLAIRVIGKRKKKRWIPTLNEKDVQRSLRIIKETQISPETLDYYIT